MKRFIPALLLLAALTLPAATTAWATSSGLIVGVVISAEGMDDRYSTGDDIHIGDRIETPADARLLLLFLDGSRLTLGGDARLHVRDFVYDPTAPGGNRQTLELERGNMLYVTPHDPAARITTPVGTAVVRSPVTLWAGMLEHEYHIFSDDGDVAFETARGRVRIRSGEASTIRSLNAVPGRPQTRPPEWIEQAKATIALHNIERAKEQLAHQTEANPDRLSRHREQVRERRDRQIETLQMRPNQRRIDLNDLQKGQDMSTPIPEPQQPAQKQPDPTPTATPAPAPETAPQPTEDDFLSGDDSQTGKSADPF